MNFEGSGSGGSGIGADGKIDPKIVMAAQQLQVQMELADRCRRLTGMCWDLCDINPKDKLDSRQEYCLSNCSERYMDTESYIKNRLMQKAQDSRANSGFS